MNECSACGLNFASVRDFDSHRTGRFLQSGPAEYLDRTRAGLVDEDWRPTLGRRCLDVDELLADGWDTDPRGRWSTACRIRPVRAS